MFGLKTFSFIAHNSHLQHSNKHKGETGGGDDKLKQLS